MAFSLTLCALALAAPATASIFNFSAVPISGGAPVALSVYAGNVTMVVNTATF